MKRVYVVPLPRVPWALNVVRFTARRDRNQWFSISPVDTDDHGCIGVSFAGPRRGIAVYLYPSNHHVRAVNR